MNPSQILVLTRALQLMFSEKKQWKNARKEIGEEFNQMGRDLKGGYDAAGEEIRKERIYQERPELRPPETKAGRVFNGKFLLILLATLWVLRWLLSL